MLKLIVPDQKACFQVAAVVCVCACVCIKAFPLLSTGMGVQMISVYFFWEKKKKHLKKNPVTES